MQILRIKITEYDHHRNTEKDQVVNYILPERFTLNLVSQQLDKLARDWKQRFVDNHLYFEFINLVQLDHTLAGCTLHTLGIREFPPNIDNLWS